MHCKWVCTILFSGLFSGCSLYKKKHTIPFFCVCLKNFRTNYTYSHLPELKGASLFWTWSFFSFSMQALFFTNSCAEFVWFLIANFFVVSHFILVMAVSSHCDRFHWGFYFQTSNAICRRFWADGTIFLSCCLVFCTNPPLIIFHCPLSSHPKDSSTTIQLSTDCT